MSECASEREVFLLGKPTYGRAVYRETPPADESDVIMIFFSPNRALSARRLIVERKMTPILSKSPESESVSLPPNHAGPSLSVSSAATNGKRRFFHLDFKNGPRH